MNYGFHNMIDHNGGLDILNQDRTIYHDIQYIPNA